MSYIEKLTTNNLVSFLRFMDCDKEKGARVSITRGVELEYEPNTELLFLQSMANKKKYGFLFSDHGLVQIFIDNDPKTPIVSMASEFGCFEQSASSIQFTKSIIGFMASIFKLDYLKDEFNHRQIILNEINKTIEKTENDKNATDEKIKDAFSALLFMNDDPSKLKEYLKTDYELMRYQNDIQAQNTYLQELYNHKNYHTKIQEYVNELALELFGTSLKTGTTRQDLKTELKNAIDNEFKA